MPKINFIRLIFITVSTIVVTTGFIACKKTASDPSSALSISDFETRLDKHREQSNIPGMVAGIIKDGKVIWLRNYGYAEKKKNIPVVNATIFPLASLTKTFAATIIMQLVSENKINLIDPVAKYGINLTEKGTVQIIHLLTHTSEGVPGNNYKYNGDRYALLSVVIESATGKTFQKHAFERIMQPLGLKNTAPSDMNLAVTAGFDTTGLKQNTSQGYNSKGTQTVDYPNNFSTAAGLISNIDDMLKYASSFDGNSLLTDDSKGKMFSAMISNDGKTLPYGLGWFIQQKEGIKLTWHYGYWVGMSSLIIRIPEKKMAFVLMANSDMLSSPYPLANGDIWVSPYAKDFLKSFILAGAKL